MEWQEVVDIEWWVLNGLLVTLILFLFSWTLYEKRRSVRDDGFQPVEQS
jgi:hypothetical protein